VARAVRRGLWHRRELRVYVYPGDAIDLLPRPALMRRDCPEDLEYYAPTDASQLQRGAYRQVAERRMAIGHHLYTRVEGRLLVHYGWLIDRQERGEDLELRQVFFPPPESAALYDYYTHPSARGRGLYFSSLCQVLHDARDLAHARQAYIYIHRENVRSRHVAEKVGFTYVGSLVATQRLFRRQRRPRGASEGFKAGLL
jgi:RimJ/RimL family protein N-acetyltransferase